MSNMTAPMRDAEWHQWQGKRAWETPTSFRPIVYISFSIVSFLFTCFSLATISLATDYNSKDRSNMTVPRDVERQGKRAYSMFSLYCFSFFFTYFFSSYRVLTTRLAEQWGKWAYSVFFFIVLVFLLFLATNYDDEAMTDVRDAEQWWWC